MKTAAKIGLTVALIAAAIWVYQDQEAKKNRIWGGEERLVTEEQEVTDLVVDFGKNLKNVSLSAEQSVLVEAIEKEYKKYVTFELLASWLTSPSTAPGRPTSSPWPERIEVDSTDRVDLTTFTVHAKVVWLTSVAVSDEESAFVQPVEIAVRKIDKKWLIGSYVAEPQS